VEGGCTLLSPPNFTLRGYSGGKDKTGDAKRVAACCQRSKYSWKYSTVVGALKMQDRKKQDRNLTKRKMTDNNIERTPYTIESFMGYLPTARNNLQLCEN